MTRQPAVPSRSRPCSAGLRHALLGALAVGFLVAQARAQPGNAAPACPDSLPELYERVSPAVVSIAAASVNSYDVNEPITRVVGSGFIIEASGLILTNSHLVFGRQAISVTLDDGTVLPAKLVGADPVLDIALIRIPPPTSGTLPVAELGDSDRVVVGEDVLVIGNPLGLQQTLTRGIVSAVNRTLPNVAASVSEPLIQTDAPINPGNSGGPLVNPCGRVLGITTAMLPNAQNIGFAVPINLAKDVRKQLEAEGRVIRPWLGVRGQLVSQPLKELLRVPLVDGLLVEIVEPGSPAERMGLHGGELDLVIGGQPVLIGGDVITAIDGEDVQAPDQLGRALKAFSIGATVHLTVSRGGEVLRVDCVLPERPFLPGDAGTRQTLAPAEGGKPGHAPATARSTRVRL